MTTARNAPITTAAARIDAVARRYHAEGRFDGALLVAAGGRVVYRAGFGVADRDRGAPVTPDTRFPVTSVTKQFTALVVLQLVEEGRLRLDAPVSDHLPGRSEAAGRVTLRHLLTHTAGLRPLEEGKPGLATGDEVARRGAAAIAEDLLAGGLQDEPGARFRYNNADYLVVGAVLERATGRPWARLVTERILSPLGLRATGVLGPPGRAPANLARGYVRASAATGGELRPEPALRRENYHAGGALYSTVDDLLAWTRALATHRLLPAARTRQMLTPLPDKGNVALGSWVYDAPGGLRRVIERRGTSGACRSLTVFTPDLSAVLVLLSHVTAEGSDPGDLFGLPAGVGLPYEVLTSLREPA